MKILLDTHVLLWALTEEGELSNETLNIINDENNDIYYSSVNIWEITLKHLIHPNDMKFDGKEISEYCREADIQQLPLLDSHTWNIGDLNKIPNTPTHKDPFDIILMTQAKTEGMTFMSRDGKMKYYDEPFIMMV